MSFYNEGLSLNVYTAGWTAFPFIMEDQIGGEEKKRRREDSGGEERKRNARRGNMR